MLRWHQVAQVGGIADREWKVISVNGSDIALFNVSGPRCPTSRSKALDSVRPGIT